MSEPILFSSSIVKYDEDGNKVISSFLDEGETMASGITYEEVLHDGTVTPVSTDTQITPLEDGDEDAEGGLTTDYTQTSTVPVGSEETKAPEDREDRTVEEGEPIQEGGVAETPADAKPKTSDNKTAWYEYAKTQGFEGTIDDLSKAELIEQYGN